MGVVTILAWPGQPAAPATQHSGVKWILPANWLPFQKSNFVTPAFPGYISGHSTFSRAAAEVLAAIAGSPYFPGGMGIYNAPAETSLTFEKGPSTNIQLQWGTYFDAADQAGLSRIWGGIHPPIDDFKGRIAGSQCGKGVWSLAKTYFDGSVIQPNVALHMRPLNALQCELRYNTLRGFYYKLQSTSDLSLPFVDDATGVNRAVDSQMVRLDSLAAGKRFYRVVGSPTP